MSSNRCFRCGQDLNSTQHPGGICNTRRTSENTKNTQRQANLQCHHRFVCFNPTHASTTLQRFKRRFTVIAARVEVPITAQAEIGQMVETIEDALGLNRPPVIVPAIRVPAVGPEIIGLLNLPAQYGPGGGQTYEIPVDHVTQYRHIKLRDMRICPFGLDCHEPEKAVKAVWRLLAILRYDIEPLLVGEGGWDRPLYQTLANTLDVLGLHDEAGEVMAIVQEEAAKAAQLRLFVE